MPGILHLLHIVLAQHIECPDHLRLITGELKTTQFETRTAHIDYNADVKGTPVDFKGTIGLAGDDTSTTLAYNNEVSVNIPFMGPAIEPKVADALGELFANEGALTDKWISENL